MTLRKILSKIGISALVLSFISSYVAYAYNLSDRYEFLEGNHITVKNNMQAEPGEIEIDGDTVVNIAPKINTSDYDTQGVGWVIDTTNNEIRWSSDGIDVASGGWKLMGNKHRWKANQTYTLVMTITNNTLSSGEYFYIDTYGGYVSKQHLVINNNALKDQVKLVFQTKEDLDLNSGFDREFKFALSTNSPKGSITFKDIMILEGDYSNQSVMYYEGMKSVGEINDDSSAFKLISSNKNLFDLSGDVNQTIFADGSGTKRNEVDTSINGLKVYHQNRWSSGLGQIIKCKPNTKYTVSATIIDEQQIGGFINSWIDGLWYGARMYFKPDGNKEKRQSFTFTTGPYQDEIKITFNNNNETGSNTSPMVIYKDIMVEESESATNYEKRVAEEKIIPLAQPLRGLPNGIKDTIIKKDGRWYIKRMTKEVVLDGSSNFNYWIENNINENTSSFVVHTGNDDSYKNHDEVNVVTDKMPFYEGYYKGRKGVSISGYGDNTAIFVGSLPNSVLKSIDGNGIAQYFRENPVRVVYRLANPIYEPLSTNLDTLMYSGNMHIFNNSKISANLKINIDRITNISISKTELAEAITDSTSLSEARSWVNEMKDSLTKDLLQKRLNDIGINDMGSVEKKTITANADIYITPQNILSLSLDTNSIIFEEYDGVEDSEKRNAVTLKVNSSLPYKINVLSPTEISNSAGDKIINKSLLNIKTSTDSSYKTFTREEKIELLSNQHSGKEQSHAIDIMLKGGFISKADIYKTALKFEVQQQ